MTHEGRMSRGAEKFSKGITDIETEYYLANKDVKPKEVIKDVKVVKDIKVVKEVKPKKEMKE